MKIATEKFKKDQISALSLEIKEKKKDIENEEVKTPEGVFELPQLDDVLSQMKHTTFELKHTNNLNHSGTRKKSSSRRRHKSRSKVGKQDKRISSEANSSDQLALLGQAMMKMIRNQSAPDVKIDSFRGDPLEFNYFLSNFQDIVESKVDDQRGRLNLLIQNTEGEAKELIKHCVYNNPDSCYDDAMYLLGKEYGNPLRIACAHMEKLRNWAIVKHGDGIGLKALYRFLLQCQAHQMQGLLTGLDSPLELRNIQLKLPTNLQDKWNHTVNRIRRDKREADFRDFVEFVETESSVLNDPIYSRSARSEKDQLKAFLTTHKVENNKDNENNNEQQTTPLDQKEKAELCIICQTPHDLDTCPEFLKKPYKDRKQLVFSKRLCFSCFGSNHKSCDCTQKKTCEVCTKNHPTSLHIFKVNAVRRNG